MVMFWITAVIVFLVVEALTIGLTSIWFALGSLAALLLSVLDAWLWLQILVFIVVSIAAIALARPLAVKYLNSRKKATNADRVLSMVGVVTDTIDNIQAKGLVKVDGKEWSARSMSGRVIQTGTLVHPLLIDGVKLIVEPIKENANKAN